MISSTVQGNWCSVLVWSPSVASGFSFSSTNVVFKVETQHHSRSNRVSLFHWNTRDICRSRFAGERQAINVMCIPMEKRDAIDVVFPPSDAPVLLLLGAQKQPKGVKS